MRQFQEASAWGVECGSRTGNACQIDADQTDVQPRESIKQNLEGQRGATVLKNASIDQEPSGRQSTSTPFAAMNFQCSNLPGTVQHPSLTRKALVMLCRPSVEPRE